MTARLYVKRGGAASLETEVMELAPSDRKGAPAFQDATPLVNLGMRCADGESSQGEFTLADPDAEIPSDTYRLPPHGLVTLTEDASGDELWMARVRVGQLSAGRAGPYRPANEVEWKVQTVDCNIDLTGNHFVHPWERPAETDIDRIIALQAHILNGDSSTAAHHRKSTVITAATVGDGHLLQDGTTHLDDSLTNLEAKTYPPGTVARDVLEDISEAAGKTYGVVIHHTGGTSHLCLLYVQELDHETYQSDIKISQNVADWNPDDPDTPVFEPIWDRGMGKQTENEHVISGLISIYGGSADNPETVFVDQSADDETPHEYWTDAYFDSDSKTEAQATFRANQILASRRPPGHTTHQLSIKMHPEQTRLLCAGMSVSVKSAVVTGAPLSYVKRRVSELRWELAPDGDWFAHLDLDRPIRVRRGSLQAPQAPDTGSPGTPGTGCTTSFTRTWSYNTNINSDSGDLPWTNTAWQASAAPMGSAYALCGIEHASYGTGGTGNSAITCAAGDTITLSGRISARNIGLHTRFVQVVFFGTSGTTFPGDVISSIYETAPATNNTSVASFSFTWTAPTGTGAVGFRIERQSRLDDLVITVADCSGATPGTDPIPSTSAVTTVGGTDEGFYTDSGEYVPVGSKLELTYIDSGGPYIYAGGISFDPTTTGGVADDVQEELELLDGRIDTLESGSSSSGPHSHPDLAEAAFTLTAAPEGGWGRITKDNLAYLNGYTYISYITGDDGDARVAVVADTDPSTVVNTVTLHAALAVDDHSAAVIAIDPSTHKLMAVYTTHGDTTVRTRVSTTSLDTDPDLGDGFASEQSLDAALGSSTYTYPNILYLADESLWYLFVRAGGSGSSADWYYSTSSDFSTWAAATKFFDEATRWVYLKPVVNGAARIDFIANDGSPANDTDVSTVAFYYEGGSWFDLDGNDLGTLPLSGADATLIADGATAETSIVDVAVLPDGNPAYLYADIEDTAHHVIHHVRWTGSALVDTTLVDSGAAIEATGTFSGHANMDPNDPMRIWVSVENGSGFYDLWQYSIEDDAPTGRRIAEGLTGADNLRPAGIPNHGDALHVVWLVGSYTDINTFDFGISGAGVTASAAGTDEKVKVSSNDTTAGYLNGKLVAGTNITLTENNDGSNETLTIAASGSGSDTAWIVDPGSPSYSGTGPVTVALTSVFGIDGSGNPYYNAAGVTDGEEAALVWDSTSGSYSLRPYYP